MTKVFSLRISTIHTLAKQQVLRDRQFVHTVHVDSCLLNEKWAFLPPFTSPAEAKRGRRSGELASTNAGRVAVSSWNPLAFSLKFAGKGERGLPALATISSKPLVVQKSRGWHISHAK